MLRGVICKLPVYAFMLSKVSRRTYDKHQDTNFDMQTDWEFEDSRMQVVICRIQECRHEETCRVS